MTVKGGPGALTRAMAEAATEAGAEIRTGAAVARVIVRDGRATGVVLDDGTEIAARAVVSNADPRRTFSVWSTRSSSIPGFLTRIRNYRCPGTAAKDESRAERAAGVHGREQPGDLHGRVHIGPGIDYLERAFDASKYGEISAEPYLDVTIPSLHDPSLAPAGAHVMSVYVQFAPYKLAGGRPGRTPPTTSGASCCARVAATRPGIEQLVEHSR